MQRSLPQKVQESLKEHLRVKFWRRIVTAMACVVVFCTTYALIIPAITMTADLYCGYEEHTHSDECYETVLACEQQETSPHTHTDACYETQSVLTCGREEVVGHTHTEECSGEDGTLACGQEETIGHTHDASCRQEEKVLVCTQSTEGHFHTDACYEKQLVCEKEEHTHSLYCYSNPDADVETRTVWEKTIPSDLGDDWAKNVVAVAKSQLGYTESTANYEVDDDGSIRGYTRYGAWYGNPYGDWCAMFASFCLQYAGVPDTSVPYASGCIYWVEQLQSAGLYESTTDCFPEPGFLVFFDSDGDGYTDHVGIVTEVAEDGETISTVEGNIDGAVVTQSYSIFDSIILGYGVLPENQSAQSNATDAEENIALAAENANRESTDLTAYLKNADIKVDGKSYQEGTTLPASKEFSVEISFANIKGRNGQTAYSYTLPAEISIPQDITDSVLKDDNDVQQGTYTVTKDAETGRTVINVVFNDDYVKANDYINLGLEVTVNWNIDNDGEHEIDFGNGYVKKIAVDGTAKLSIDKTHTITVDDRNANYSIVVTAATNQQNVHLSDSVSYAEISYKDAGGVQHTEQIGAELKIGGMIEAVLTGKDGNSSTLKTTEITDQNSLNAFLSELKLDMKAGETLTINYPMEYSAATGLKADVYTKNLHTYNTAGVKSDAITDEITAEEDWTYYGNQNRIVQKTAELVGDSAKWELVLNYGANYPMAGTLIYDALQSNALSYDMDRDFVIGVYTKDKTLVRTDSLPWKDILWSDSRGWNFTVPSTDGDNQYIYVISYYTKVDTDDTGALNNVAGARFNQYPAAFGEGGIDIGTQTDARKIEIEIQKEGKIVDEKNRITEWTIKYMVLPGSGQTLYFGLLDYLPSYEVNGETKYAKLIKNDGTVLDYNDGQTAIDASHDGTGSGDVFSISISRYLDTSGKSPDYTAGDFQKLLTYLAYYWHDSVDCFAIVDYDTSTGFTLPAAVGDYADGYVVTIKYRTMSEGIGDGGSLTNSVGVGFTDLSGQYQWLPSHAKVTFPVDKLENSITMDKTGNYNADADKVHYTVNVDTKHIGFRSAGYVAITDDYDDRLDFRETMYYLALGVPDYTLPDIPVYLKSVSESLVITEQVATPEGFSGTTWKTTYPQLDVYAMNENGEIEKVSDPWIYTILDRENHTFTLYLPYSYMGKIDDEYFYLSYTLDYDLSVPGNDRSYNNVLNTVTATGDNGIRYGEASTTFSFAQLLTTKTLIDSVAHEHSQECYTFNFEKWTDVLTCPLTAAGKNEVLFKVRVNIGASTLQNMNQVIIDDYMDSSKLTPDIENLQMRFVNTATKASLSFDDACTIAGVTDSFYKTELTQSGLTVTVCLGQKDGQDCSVKNFCNAFNASDIGKQYELNLTDFKLELSYPAKVIGSLGETVTVKNQANLRGVDYSGSEVVYDKVVQGSSGGVSGHSYTINIWKIDAVSTGGEITSLPNTHFNLCDESGTVIASAITDDTDGKISFGAKGVENAGLCKLSPYTAYYLIETEPPDGYVLDTTKHWFYFTAPDGTDEQKAFTEEEKARLEEFGCVPMSMDSTLQVYNSRTVFFIIKKVDDETLELLTGAEFTLYSDQACQAAVQISRTSGDGMYQLDGLELGTTYYLKETRAPKGYIPDEEIHTVLVDSNGAITIDDLEREDDTLTYVYTNTKQTYFLPETGGVGTLLFTIDGTLLLVGSLLSGYILRRKQKRRFIG